MHSSSGFGAIAQLGERVLCKHEVVGSIPSGSTSFRWPSQLRLKEPIDARDALRITSANTIVRENITSHAYPNRTRLRDL